MPYLRRGLILGMWRRVIYEVFRVMPLHGNRMLVLHTMLWALQRRFANDKVIHVKLKRNDDVLLLTCGSISYF